MHSSISGLLLLHWVHHRVLPDRARDDRGDVPGWVMVTVMSAAVVAGMLPFVDQELNALLSSAFASVKPGS